MTDAQIVRWLAEKVLGWKVPQCFDDPLERDEDWNPLTDARDTERVMEALRAKGWEWEISESEHGTYAEVYRPEDRMVFTDENRRWKVAFCLAAVRATGGEV